MEPSSRGGSLKTNWYGAKLNAFPLQVTVTNTFGIDEAEKAYQLFDTGKTGKCAILYQGEKQVFQGNATL